MQYAKDSGEKRGLQMYGVLYDSSSSSSSHTPPHLSGNQTIPREILLSPSQYLWRADLIQRMTAQLQTKEVQVGLMDDMSSSAVAYLSLLCF